MEVVLLHRQLLWKGVTVFELLDK